jgi:hypothetical protein
VKTDTVVTFNPTRICSLATFCKESISWKPKAKSAQRS